MSIDRKKAFSTRSIHTGEPADPSTQAVEPSLVLSTNFVFDPDSADFSAETLNEKTPNVYARWSSPTVRALEVKLADLEDGEDALCFASGMELSPLLFWVRCIVAIISCSAMFAMPEWRSWRATRCRASALKSQRRTSPI